MVAVRLIDNVVSGLDRAPGELLTESSESKRAKRKPEIAQGNVEVPWNQQQIHDDAEEPCRHDVSADSWPRGDQHRCRYLHEPDEEHEGVTRDWEHSGNHRSEIAIPVGEDMRELVESRQ